MKQRSSSQQISKGQFSYYLLTLLIIAGGVANAQNNPGVIRGAIVMIESDGSRSMIPGATVVLESAEVARQATADGVGSYTFADLPAGRYQIRASAPGLVGSASAEIHSGESLDVEIPMAIETECFVRCGYDGRRSSLLWAPVYGDPAWLEASGCKGGRRQNRP